MSKSSRPLSQASLSLALLAALVGCANFDAQPTRDVGWELQLQDVVAGDAALILSPEGSFALPPPPAVIEGQELISVKRARQLAAVWVANRLRNSISFWTEQRGAPIEIDLLAVEDRAYFGDTPFGPPASVGRLLSTDRHFGPHYIVGFCQGSDRVLTVAVAAVAQNVEIVDGDIRPNDIMDQGAEFVIDVMPVSVGLDSPVSPEEAVMFAARTLRQRVVGIPHFLQGGPRFYAPQAGSWWMEMEHPQRVMASNTGVIREARIIGVAPTYNRETKEHRLVLIVPAVEQPDSLNFRIPKRHNFGERSRGMLPEPEFLPGQIPIRRGMALVFDTVSSLLPGEQQLSPPRPFNPVRPPASTACVSSPQLHAPPPVTLRPRPNLTLATPPGWPTSGLSLVLAPLSVRRLFRA